MTCLHLLHPIIYYIQLYADYVILYRAILSSEDAILLQEDLNKLVSWAVTWLMSLNLDKCEHLRIKKLPYSSHI